MNNINTQLQALRDELIKAHLDYYSAHLDYIIGLMEQKETKKPEENKWTDDHAQ